MTMAHADLRCETCDEIVEHELHYAGRILESVRCCRCGTHMELAQSALLPAYVHDLEQRLASKPRRLAHRAVRDPIGFSRNLPRAVLRQPLKFLREFKALWRR